MINNKGKNNPMYGKKHSEETKKKIAESRKKYRGENHPSWKGGRRISANGYIEVHNPGHHRARANGYVFEHILVVEEDLGRKLEENEQVHHVNKNKQDNRPENLMVLDRAEHTKHHAPERRKGKNVRCATCGEVFYLKPSHVKEFNYCSLSCAGKKSTIGVLNKKLTDDQLIQALKENTNVKIVAKKLGVAPTTIYRRIKKLGDAI